MSDNMKLLLGAAVIAFGGYYLWSRQRAAAQTAAAVKAFNDARSQTWISSITSGKNTPTGMINGWR